VLGVALLAPGMPGPPPPPAGPGAADAAVTAALAGSRSRDGSAVAAAMTAAGPPYAGWAADGRRFVLFDPRGDGRAAEVVGDLATADRVVVLVPGVDTRLADFDRGLGGVARRAPGWQARAVASAVRAADPGARVAVVAWLGYDPPDGLGVGALRWDSAAEGARLLVRFVDAVLTAQPRAGVIVVGHSYGAVVAGLAAADLDARVTDLVAVAGPGMGGDRVADLRTGARVWAAEAPEDWIRRVPGVRLFGLGHGRRPADPRFGARRLPTGGVTGHDGYLVPGTESLAAIARIAAGWTDGLARADELARADGLAPADGLARTGEVAR
jgi:pimeloyl-ACP methyl ester carboxylesterase